jgi:hypothetical protein
VLNLKGRDAARGYAAPALCADIDQRLAELVVGIGLAKSRLVPHPGVQFDHIYMVMVPACALLSHSL